MKDSFYWIHPKTKIKLSKIHGYGRFSLDKIKKNELVMAVGGRVIDKRFCRWTTGVPVSSNLIIQASDEFLDNGVVNHSCNPNLIINGDICFYAFRDIQLNEELTVDYGSFLSDDNEKIFIQDCYCLSKDCRSKVTGQDWKKINPEFLCNYLRRKYYGF